MTSSRIHGRGAARAWVRRLLRGCVLSNSAAEGILVARSMGRYVPLDATATADLHLVTLRANRGGLLTEWTRSGALTDVEAETLMALDQTTPWRV